MYFEQCQDLNELKREYKRLVMLYHPDRPNGDEETMKAINGEYDRMFLLLKAKQNTMANDDVTGKTRRTTETPEEFREIVSILLKLEGIEIELVGAWLWLSGNSWPHRQKLRQAGCRWSSSKKRWYWRHEEDDCYWSRGTTTMQEIRQKYGSEWLREKEEHATLPA